MARSRMLRPSFFTDPEFNTLSPGARLLYFGLLTNMDRNGVMLADPGNIRAIVFPCDNKMRRNHITKWLDELSQLGRVILFTHNGVRYLLDPDFADHQKIYSNDPDIYRIPVGTRFQLIQNNNATRLERSRSLLNLNQNLNLKDLPETETVDNSGGSEGRNPVGRDEASAPRNGCAMEGEAAEIERLNKRLIENRAAKGLKPDGGLNGDL